MFEIVIYNENGELACKMYYPYLTSRVLQDIASFLREHEGYYVFGVNTIILDD